MGLIIYIAIACLTFLGFYSVAKYLNLKLATRYDSNPHPELYVMAVGGAGLWFVALPFAIVVALFWTIKGKIDAKIIEKVQKQNEK